MRIALCCLSLFGALSLTSSLYAGESLRVATYNLNNYLVMDRHVDNRWRPSYPKPENEKVIVRQNILRHAPDILALQEIGPLEFLEELRADLAREGLHYTYAVHLEGPDPDRHLALLSKLPPKDVKKHTDLDFKYLEGRERVKRGMLEVAFDPGNGDVFKVFVVHLKSRYTVHKEDPDSELRRLREAEACRNRIVERTREIGKDRFMVVGDFNDHPDSATMRRFYRRGDLDIGSLLPASDSRGDVWTYYYKKHGQYSLVDGFVLSDELFSDVNTGRAHIVDTPGTMIGSDHRMIYLDLDRGNSLQTAGHGSESSSTN
ncbi:MAG: endonuclease/exonuclease/phosphatase family protein [Verrucomicrobiota bacterium]